MCNHLCDVFDKMVELHVYYLLVVRFLGLLWYTLFLCLCLPLASLIEYEVELPSLPTLLYTKDV